MARNRIRFFLCIGMILERLDKISSEEVVANDDNQLEPNELIRSLNWTIDSVKGNNDHSSHSIFWYKEIASCFLVVIEPYVIIKPHGVAIFLYNTFKDYPQLLEYFSGKMHGQVLTLDENINYIERGCPYERVIRILYTDYSNVFVLMRYDIWSGTHIMILKSSTTSMTYEERTDLVKSKVRGFNLGDLLKVVSRPFCNITNTLWEDFKNIQNLKCKKYIQYKMAERLYTLLLGLFVLSGALWIALNWMCWMRKQSTRVIIAPEYHQ